MKFRAIVPAVAIAIATLACSAADASEADPSMTSPGVTTPGLTAPAPELTLVDAIADDESFTLGATPLDIVEGRTDALHVNARLAWVEGLSAADTELMIDYSDDQLLATPLLELCVRSDAPPGTVELTVCPGADAPPPIS